MVASHLFPGTAAEGGRGLVTSHWRSAVGDAQVLYGWAGMASVTVQHSAPRCTVRQQTLARRQSAAVVTRSHFARRSGRSACEGK
jgi:hypothetical protein